MTDTAKDIVAWLRRAALNQKRYTEPMENKAATLIEQQAKRIAELEAQLAAPVAAQEPKEMRLCESVHLGLRPDQHYVFTVDENCAECVKLAAPYRA
jgi:hypothetical protein